MADTTEKGGDTECTKPSYGTKKPLGWLDRKVFTGEFEDKWIDMAVFGIGLLLAYCLAFGAL